MVKPFSSSEIKSFRNDFPFFADPTLVGGKPLAYLDSGATSQRPKTVLDAERFFLEKQNSAVHRGASIATGTATSSFEASREAVAKFVGAEANEIVWTAGATDALNLIAQGIAEANTSLGSSSNLFKLEPGDEILVTEAEHHANLVPWQRLALKTGASLRWIPVNEHGTWSIDDARSYVNKRTKIFAFGHVSNVTGFKAPVRELTDLAHSVGAVTVLDACQSVPHVPVNFTDLGVDFAVFSSHKMLGPNGLGVLYGKAGLLAELPPARTGGSAITRVTMEQAEFLPPPLRFEAGTQAVSQVIGLGAAVKYLEEIGMQRIASHEEELVAHLVEGVNKNSGLRLLGPQNSSHRVALASVEVNGLHAHDVGQVLDGEGVQVRVGHHCAQPLHRAMGITSSVRASVHLTTTENEIDRFLDGLRKAQKYFDLES